MKRSKTISLGLVGSIAFVMLTMPGCADEPVETRRCVDSQQIVAEDEKCGGVDADPTATPSSTPTPNPDGSHPVVYPYRWYYGGPPHLIPIGSQVTGGSFEPPAGVHSFAHPTSRGVIGRSAGIGS